MEDDESLLEVLLPSEKTSFYQEPAANPFMTLRLSSEPLLYKIIKFSIGILVLLPIRAVLTIFLFLIQVLILKCGTVGLEDPHQALPTWRKIILWPSHKLSRIVLFVWGFYWIPTKGKPELNSMLAPIIVGNHVTFFDGFYLYSIFNGSGISRVENDSIPIIGTMIKGSQSISVDRSSAESRKASFQLITQRAQSAYTDRQYKPLIMFPEGTTTNGTALIQFKVGAFAPGVPVQAVFMRYPNKYCDLTWPPNAHVGRTVFFMLCQFVNYMEAEFLPPYIPNEEEKANPQLYANNVRSVMAKSANVPTTEHSYEDCKLMIEADKYNLPEESITSLQMESIEKIFNLTFDDAIELLKEFVKHDREKKGTLTLEDFAKLLKLPFDHESVKEMLQLIDSSEDGRVSFKDYILWVATMRSNSPEESIKQSFKAFDINKDGLIFRDEFKSIIHYNFSDMSDDKIDFIFDEMDKEKTGSVTYDQYSAYVLKNPQFLKIKLKHLQKENDDNDTVEKEPLVVLDM